MTDTALATATVVWRARAVGQDTDDPSGLPDEYPLAGVKVRLIPSPRKIEVAAPPGGVAPTTYTLRTWDLVTSADGSLVNLEDAGEGIQIVASDAIDGVQIEWTSIIDAPDSGVPAISKVWLAPAGSTVDLTTVESIPPSPGSLAEYLQAVRDARAARDIAVASGAAASAAAERAEIAAQGANVAQITLTGNLALTIPEGHPAGQVYRCAITQTTGGHTVTYDGAPVDVDTAAGAVTTVELHPVGAGYVVRYPVTNLDAQVSALAEDGGSMLGASLSSTYASVQQAGITSQSGASDSAHPRVRLIGPLVTLAQQSASSFYAPSIVDRSAGGGSGYSLFYSTDHASTHASSGIFQIDYESLDALLAGQGTDRGRVWRDDAGGAQTETPFVLWDDEAQLWRMFYQQQSVPGAVGVQSTLMATSPDMTTWTRVGIALDKVRTDHPGDGHTGYCIIFQAYGRRWAASLYGGGVDAYNALWATDDYVSFRWIGFTNRSIQALASLPGYQDGSDGVFYVAVLRSAVVDYRGRPWLITRAHPGGSGPYVTSGTTVVVPLSNPPLSLAGPALPAFQESPSAPWLTDGVGDIGYCGVTVGGRTLVPFRSEAANGYIGLAEVY